jgi:hypothetical protein
MRRLTLSSLVANWRKAASFGTVLLVGALFGNLVIPYLFRDEIVYSIIGSEPKGCENTFGLAPFRFGFYGGQGTGVYHIPCDDRIHVADTVQLHCVCR